MFQTTSQIFFIFIRIHSTSWTLCNTSIFAKLSPNCRQESVGNLRTVHFAAVRRVVIQVEPVLIAVNRGAIAGSWDSEALRGGPETGVGDEISGNKVTIYIYSIL